MARLEQCIVDAADELGISEKDAAEIADRLKSYRQEKAMQRRLANIDEDVRKLASDKAEEARIAAAQKRKHAALNIIAKRKLAAHVEGLVAGGMDERKAIQTFLVGSVEGIASARKSVHARRIAIEDEWLDGMWRELKRDRPHLGKMITKGNAELMEDVAREMWEIRPNGKRGATGNKDAEYLAGLLSKYLEMSRLRMNEAGAFIGKLDGYIPQHHDDIKVGRAGFEGWKKKAEALVDRERTFRGLSAKEIDRAYEEIYQNIVTGKDRTITGKEQTGRTGPANIADQLNQHRVLHFKNADSWLAYQSEFGHGNAVTAAINQLHQSARTTSLMETMGPNPKHLLNSFIAERQRQIREDPNLSPDQKKERIDALKGSLDNPTTSRIANAFAQVSGDTLASGSSVWAKRAQAVRSWKAMATLGSATLSAVPTDIWSMAAEMRFQGKGMGAATIDALRAGFRGRSATEKSNVTDLIDIGFEQVFGEISARFLADDMVPGTMAKAVERFFRWTGMTGWTVSRRSAFQVITSGHFAQNAKLGWDALPDRFRHLMRLHGIDAKSWPVAQKMIMTDENGKSFMVPDMARDLPDADVDRLIADELADVRKRLEGEALERRIGQLRAQGRRDFETQLRGYLTDEADFGVLDLEDADRMIVNAGTKPGTVVGEIVRFTMALKGFPVSFTRKVLGRAFRGGIKRREGMFGRTDFGQVAWIIAGMTIAGYVAGAMKDITKNRTPKDPTNPSTWLSAMLQGGGLGIWGDFFISKTNRFGNTELETLVGPVIGEAASLLKLGKQTATGDARMADWIRAVVNNTPGNSIWYTRGALDYMVLRHLEEWANPGITRRRERRLEEEFGQAYIFGG